MPNFDFSQPINTLEYLTSADIANSKTHVLASNLQENMLFDSKAANISCIQDNTVKYIEKVPEFNPAGVWNFTKGVSISDKTYNYAIKNNMLDTVVPKHMLHNDFMRLLNSLSAELYTRDHIPSAVGEVIFSTKLRTEADVKKVYGAETSWKKIPGRFILATNTSNGQHQAYVAYRNALRVSGVRGGEATHAIEIKEIPKHQHAFTVKNDDTQDLSMEKIIAFTDETIGDVLSKQSGDNGGEDDNRMREEYNKQRCKSYSENKSDIKISYELEESAVLYGNSGANVMIRRAGENVNGAHNNMPPFYSVHIWERIL